MTRKPKVLLGAGLLLAAVAASWIVLSDAERSVRAEPVLAARPTGSGILDGMTFSSVLGPAGKPADVKDTLVFEKGMFVSEECERRCNYPARPYFVRRKGEKIEFISETRCPDRDARIVWRGTIHDEKIEGVFTWTTARWYWTIEKEFWFEGTLADGATPIARN